MLCNLIILMGWFYCIPVFFVMSVELSSLRWGEIPGLFAFLHLSSVYMHLSLLTLLVSWKASVIPESPGYFYQYCI